MGRKAREKGDPHTPTRYHVWTPVVQRLFLLIDRKDKEEFLRILHLLMGTYFVELVSFEIMDNHFHLVIKIYQPHRVPIEEVKRRFKNLYPKEKFHPEKAQEYLEKWGDLSMFMKSLNERFAKYFNKTHGTSGHFWACRFKSVILGDERAMINCMAYVDLNAVKARMVENPEDFPYGSIYYILHRQKDEPLINIGEYRDLFSSTSIGREYDEIARQKFSARLSYLNEEDREAYIRYLAWVAVKREGDLLRKIEEFTNATVLGEPENMEYIFGKLSPNRSWKCYNFEIGSITLTAAK